jgi:excisionase family DNA binding protein
MQDLLMVEEVAKILRVSLATVYRLCKSGEVAHLRLGVGKGSIRFEAQAIEDYKRKVTQAARPVDSGNLRFLK